MPKKRLTEEKCWELFREERTLPHVIRHCRAVSDTAYRIGRALNENGGKNFDLELARMAGLIHDVARSHDHHELAGANLLDKLGYHDEAEIVRAHMTHVFNSFDHMTETDLVCLGDRLCVEDKFVGVDERIEYLVKKRKGGEKNAARIRASKKFTQGLVDDIAKAIGQSVESLFPPPLDHLLKQVEKPARYTGGEINMVRKDPVWTPVRMGFAFPDLYEIGMSYMGLQILYNCVNQRENLYCERVFQPAPDMEKLMRECGMPLFTLETKTDVRHLDVFGFTLQYEMSFPTILDMLELAEIPLKSEDRTDADPLIVAGGPCAFNPEPLADFIDLFMIGDGEELLPDMLELYGKCRSEGKTKEEFLKEAVKLTGIYVPRFYQPVYNEDGTVKEYRKLYEGAPDRVKKAIVPSLEDAPFPTKNIIPFIETVHDRSVVESFRGCSRGCRFCQAGMIYRPVRERSQETIRKIVDEQLKNTGHDEVSLLSLSTSDYSAFEELATGLMGDCRKANVSLSLPSLRLDSFSFNVLNEIQKYKKSGLTFACEAGTQRLRDVINKGVTEEDLFSAVRQAVELGWRQVKLYFMDGLPAETDEDLRGIGKLAEDIMQIWKDSGRRGRFQVTASVSNFVPKAHTPFQWAPQPSTEEMRRKHQVLRESFHDRRVRLTYHDDAVSKCEGIFARGDRRTGKLLVMAHQAGCRLDGWTEYFDRDVWARILEEWDIDYRFYTDRQRDYEEVLPWDIIDPGVTKHYLLSECRKAHEAATTPDCRWGCTHCGIKARTSCPLEGFLADKKMRALAGDSPAKADSSVFSGKEA